MTNEAQGRGPPAAPVIPPPFPPGLDAALLAVGQDLGLSAFLLHGCGAVRGPPAQNLRRGPGR